MTRLTNTAGIAMLAAAAASLAAMGCIVEIGGGDGEAPERGAFAAGAATTAFHAVAPFRRLDTRGGSKLREGKARCLVLAGQDGIPVSVTAVVMNVAVVKPAKQGWLVAYPYGSKLPGTSTLNFAAGQVVANAAIVEVGGGGKVCFYAVASTDFIVDVVGYFGSKSGYVPLAPFRRISERGSKRPGSGATRCFQVAGRDGIPKDARAVALNLTAAAVTGSGYFTAYPKGAKRPTTSNLNYRPGGATANDALVAVGQRGRICIYTRATTHYLLDIVGYWPDNGTSAAPLSHPRVYKVKSASALLNALETATSGDRVEVAPTASIDLSQHKEITIAAGVTITGGRSATQAGALIHSAKRDTLPWYRSWSLLRAAGAKITVRGVRLRGPDGTIDTHGQFVAYGVRATHDDFLIKGSELYNWPAAGVSVSGRNAVVRGNWIHDNIRVGRGYGVVVGKTKNAAVIEHNSFRRNRHAIAGSGHGSYIVRHNRFLASDAAGVHTLVDMHGVNEHTLDNSTQQAGVLIHVHNNDFEYVGAGHPIIGIRGIPAQLAVIENNCLASTRWTWITQSLMYAYPAPKSGMSCYQKASTWLCHTPRYGSAIQGITVRSNQLGRATGCR